jgi:HD-GYP domain-containing protein (c-di-GMP phosphodiesterase class II)
MSFTTLESVRERVHQGKALPFNVYNHDQTLVLAKGQMVQSLDFLGTLLARGSLVDLDEIPCDAHTVTSASASKLPELWSSTMDRMHQVLTQADPLTLQQALEEVAEPVQALIDRDPDLAILRVVRQDENRHTQYGVNHAVHTAIVCRLITKRLGWSEPDSTRSIKAALTMNLSMFELQGVLAEQDGRPTAEQRAAIFSHPVRSREMLERSGIQDDVWLTAVEQHHSSAEGKGYPAAVPQQSRLAALLCTADIYSAKLSPRRTREPLPADRATREMFMRDPGSAVASALVKEFGLYPPGSFVELASGEKGVVIKRGPLVMCPRVMVLFDAKGLSVHDLVGRDTTKKEFTIRRSVTPQQLKFVPATAHLQELVTA